MEIQKVQQQSLSQIKNLQDAIMMLSDQPHLQAYGQRKLNPLKTFENRYTWTTIRTVLEEAQQVGSALLYLQAQNKISTDDFKIAIIGSNTQQECIINLASVMYNITQIYIEDDLDTVELDHFLDQVDAQFLFGLSNEVNKILQSKKLNLQQVYVFDYENIAEDQQDNVQDFDKLLDIGQDNRSPWQEPKNDTVYGVFFDVKKQFQVVTKTQQQLLHDIVQTQQKLKLEQTRQTQGTYISLNGSANYYEHVFRLYNLMHLHNRIALPSVYKNYLTDLYFAQPTIVLANFNANYNKIHKDLQNYEVDFQKQKQNLVKQKDSFFKGLLKGIFFQQPLDQIKYHSVKNVVSINEASYHNVRDLLEESLDLSEANFIKVLNFLEHDGLYRAEDVEFNDCEALKKYQKNDEGFLVLKNGSKKNALLDIGSIKNGQVYLDGLVNNFVQVSDDKFLNTREVESFYRNKNPNIHDMFVDVDKKTKKLVAIVDINKLTKSIDVTKDQNDNKNMKENTLQLLNDYLEKENYDKDAKITKIYVEQNSFRQKNLLDKFGHKKVARFTSLYQKELDDLKSDKQ